MVEAQFENSTRKLVDSDAEQALLENLIERVKPPAPSGAEFENLHYLLFTPFRHPPLKNGSRFGTRAQRGIFYAAASKRTALAEWAYYRFVFLEGSAADLGNILQPLTLFSVWIKASAAVDLTDRPFEAHRAEVSDPKSYLVSQPLGLAMRLDGIEAFSYFSARDGAGVNYGLFVAAFGAARPRTEEAWSCNFNRAAVEYRRRSVLSEERHRFSRDQFEIDGRLPVPASG